MKIIIYLDILLLVNFLTGYLLLCAAGHLAGSETSGLRLLAGGLAAAAASLLILFPPLPVPLQLMSKALVGAFVVRTAFSWRGWRMFGRQTAWFLLLNLIAAGSCLLLSLRCGIPGLQVNNLTVYLNLPPMLLLGCILAVYGIVRTLLFLFGARFAMIFASSGLDPALQIWLCRKTIPQTRGLIFGWAASARSFGWFVAPLAGGIVTKFLGIRYLFVVGPVFFILIMFLILRVMKRFSDFREEDV